MALLTGPLWAFMIVCGRSWRGPPMVLWWLGLTSRRYLPPLTLLQDKYSERGLLNVVVCIVFCYTNS